LLDTVQKLHPILLKSVHEYLAAVQSALDEEMDKLQCTIAGGSAQLGAEFPRRTGGSPAPIEEFHIEEKRLLAQLGSHSPPQVFIDTYSDLHHQASVKVRQMNISNQEAARHYQAAYRRLASVWLTVPSGFCKNADECFAKERTITQQIIGSSDPRDVAAAGALESLKTIKPPDEVWYRAFDPNPYNQSIGGLIDIQQYIFLEKQRREDNAAALVERANAELDDMTRSVNVAMPLASKQYEFPCHYIIYWESLAKAAPYANAAENAGNELEKMLNDAVRMDGKNQAGPASAVRTGLSAQRMRIEDIRRAKPMKEFMPGCSSH
jgi:hypothetical protein